jgi:hypothetical protein
MLISTGRAASTAIYRYLNLAGSLNLPENKEPHHWCNINKYEGLYGELLHIYTESVDAYWDLYRHSRFKLDASCGYFYYIDEVIDNLRVQQQMPRVIFLYREPVSRAVSLFNELRRKKLTGADTLERDLAQKRKDGLWWERYYDNVLYDRNFCKIRDYFHEIIAINYDYFAQNQATVLEALIDFLNLPISTIDGLKLKPVNTSQEALSAVYLQKHPLLAFVVKRLPASVKESIQSRIFRYSSVNDGAAQRRSGQIESYLSNSLAEYRHFRARIDHQDLIVIRGSD